MARAGRKAVYKYVLYKGESEVARGTIAEIADITGLKKDSIRNLQSPFYKNRLKGKNHKRLEKIGEINE